MRRINKRIRKYRLKAHRIVIRFLKQGWDEYSERYVNCDFESFRRNRHFTSLLHREQNELCCYCMRSLNLEEKGLHTIEHVMPHNVKDTDVAFYYSNVPHLRKLVCRLKIDKTTPRLKVMSPYPHFCAYENLVLSCSGAIYATDKPETEIIRNLHECCNNARGDLKILPVFFENDSLFVYNDDGTMNFPEKYEDSIRILRLESNDNLRLIRKTWSELMWNHTISEVRHAIDDVGLRKRMLADTILNFYEVRRMEKNQYWQLLYDYRWFGEYFSKRHKSK